MQFLDATVKRPTRSELAALGSILGFAALATAAFAGIAYAMAGAVNLRMVAALFAGLAAGGAVAPFGVTLSRSPKAFIALFGPVSVAIAIIAAWG